MRKSIILLCLLFSFIAKAQEPETNIEDQNPNHEKISKKYLLESKSFSMFQGLTVQSTYKAIDPIEEKRLRKKMYRDYRSKRYLWRHQERMERASDSGFYGCGYDYGYDCGYVRDYNAQLYNTLGTLFTVGLVSYLIFD